MTQRICAGILASLALISIGCSDSDRGNASDDASGTRRDGGIHDAGRRDAAATPPLQEGGSDIEPIDAGPDAARRDAGHDALDAFVQDTGPAPADASNDTGTASPDANIEEAGTPETDGSLGDPDSGPSTMNDARVDDPDSFDLRIVALGLDSPWEITWGPDDRLWITERTGRRVIRVDPVTGTATTALEVTDAYQDSGQDGVLGMALDPRLGRSNGGDYVYLAYTYDADFGPGLQRRAKIVRYTYDAASQTLGAPWPLIEDLPASTDHNSGRLVYGPDDRLYYTIGDQGRNQFDNKCLPNRAQELPSQAEVDQEDWSTYQGKILRLSLDGSIPSDNPVLGGVRSHIYSYGHRNAQGLAFGPEGKLYASEQGPKTDDEINVIVAGGNYGWPHIAGYRDDAAYVYGNWSASSPQPCETLFFSDYGWPASVPEQLESEWSSSDFVPPIATFYTVETGYDFMDPACAGNEFICWPTIAPASLDIYRPGSNGFRSWGTSLLMPSLKHGSVFRVRLSASGSTAIGVAVELFKTTNRYRDIAIAPDKRTFYVVTDSYGQTSGPTSGSTQELEHRGAILEFTPAD